VDTSGHDEFERRLLTGHHWWTLTELEDTTERVSPVGLAGLLRRLLSGGVPATHIRLPRRPG